MTGSRKILRWLTATAVLQVTLIFVVSSVLASRLRAVQTGIRDLLLGVNVAVEQVDKVNQVFKPILNEVLWLFWAGILLTSVGFALLRRVVIEQWKDKAN